MARFKRLMFESYLASTIISTYGKSLHLKIIQKINNRLAQLAVARLFNLKFYRTIDFRKDSLILEGISSIEEAATFRSVPMRAEKYTQKINKDCHKV